MGVWGKMPDGTAIHIDFMRADIGGAEEEMMPTKPTKCPVCGNNAFYETSKYTPVLMCADCGYLFDPDELKEVNDDGREREGTD